MARTAVYIIKTLLCKVVLICVSLSSDLEVKTIKKTHYQWTSKNV